MTFVRLAASLWTLAALAACSSGGSTSSPSPDPTDPPAEPITVDWVHLDDFRPIDDGRWTLRDCEGDAPLLCVERDATLVGHIELLQFDRDTFGSNARSLDALSDDHETSSERDRSSSCPDSFDFEVQPRAEVPVAGEDGVRSTWTVSDAYGNEVERVVTYFGLRDDRVIVFGADGLAGDACIAREGDDGFTPALLAAAVPLLDRVVVGSLLPPLTSD